MGWGSLTLGAQLTNLPVDAVHVALQKSSLLGLQIFLATTKASNFVLDQHGELLMTLSHWEKLPKKTFT